MNDFAVFILTHGRADNVRTYDQLRRQGYSGDIFLIVDDMDDTVDEYRKRYGDQVFVFNKRAAADRTDACDNLNDMRAVVFARNECFRIAPRIGVKYFLVLDDDYTAFNFRFNDRYEWTTKDITSRNLDRVFAAFVDFLKATPTKTITMAQGGDYIGGAASKYGSTITLTRKAMNSFFCDATRPIEFMGRINEDVNAYCRWATVGDLFFTNNQIALNQAQTQQNARGLTDIYLSLGTYVKSFYTVLVHPSGAVVSMMNSRTSPRIHHKVDWIKTTPMIIREDYRKATVE